MHEQRRDPRPGDDVLAGAPPPDELEEFTDWDNPEDWDEDAPEGYYDEDEDGGYIPTPDDPDYDLSEAAGYAGWEQPRSTAIIPRWVIVVASLVLIFAILIPVLIRIS